MDADETRMDCLKSYNSIRQAHASKPGICKERRLVPRLRDCALPVIARRLNEAKPTWQSTRSFKVGIFRKSDQALANADLAFDM